MATGAETGSKSSDSTKGSPVSTEKAPAGERSEQDPGHAYADILNGKRSGLYINTSGNARNGQAFVLVTRGEREYHIYGSGKDRQVFGLTAAGREGRRPDTPTTSTDRRRRPERPPTPTTPPNGPHRHRRTPAQLPAQR